MCKQQQPKIKATSPTLNTPTTRATLEEKLVDFVSCGLDQSCPASVTTPQGQGVRLDQYQSSIREKTNKRRRQKIFEGCETSVKSTRASFNVSGPATCADTSIFPDHEFEWYDLDEIRGVDSGNNINDDGAIIISHDFHAGLVFSTERQVLSKVVEVNVVNSSVRIKDSKIGQEFEFDLFFWVNNDHLEVGETQDERDFRERIEEVEQEFKIDLSSLSSSSLHSSSSFSSSSSNRNEAKNENDCEGNSRFFASWLFEDANI